MIGSVWKNLDEIVSFFGEIIEHDNRSRSGFEIGWRNYRSGILSGIGYINEYITLCREKQYSFKLTDESLLQFYYEYDVKTEKLKKARLAYYPFPLRGAKAQDELQWMMAFYEEKGILEDRWWFMQQLSEKGGEQCFSHFRLDYDESVQSHCKAHFQFGAINELRLPSLVVVNPFVFLALILPSLGGCTEVKNKDLLFARCGPYVESLHHPGDAPIAFSLI